MRKLAPSFLAASVAFAAVPAFSQHQSTPPAKPLHAKDRDGLLATTLRARIASINARIDMLRDRDALGSEEAQELLKQSRRLQNRLYGLSPREAVDVETGIDRLERQVGFAMDDARWGGHSFNRDFRDRHVDGDQFKPRYDIDRHDHYEHFDRYTGSSVDGWHDPFDRGNNP